MKENQPALYVIATPIGNLEDITLRALRLLKEVDLILCEDTRVTKKLLDRYEVSAKLKRLDANTESEMMSEASALFEEYASIALVTDAGTPGISDPGSRFVRAARDAGIIVVAIPGPSAVTTLLSVAGLAATEFTFLGFLPHKKGRETLFKEIAQSERVIIFYESPHRIIKALESLEKVVGEGRKIIIGRELTKMFEEVIEGSARQLIDRFGEHPDTLRGEFVVIVEALS